MLVASIIVPVQVFFLLLLLRNLLLLVFFSFFLALWFNNPCLICRVFRVLEVSNLTFFLFSYTNKISHISWYLQVLIFMFVGLFSAASKPQPSRDGSGLIHLILVWLGTHSSLLSQVILHMCTTYVWIAYTYQQYLFHKWNGWLNCFSFFALSCYWHTFCTCYF